MNGAHPAHVTGKGEMRMTKLALKMTVLLLVLVSIGTCGNKADQDTTESATSGELKEYEGVKLSSVASDFVENSIEGPQQVDREKYRLQVTGLVDSVRTFTYDQLVSRPGIKKVVTLNCVEGWSATILWEGFLVRDLLSEAGVESTANTVIFHASDGYSTSFPLSYVTENDIIMAHRMNGLTMPPERGFPFELVAEGKWGYKWIRWIDRIELSDNDKYRGFWESRGYSNDGDLKKGFFD
jgi:DMSO/TMAO reductase YedYZ molybdopterin-dependent catalytic subunit